MERIAGAQVEESPPGMTFFGIFLVFATLMASLAGTTLLWPGSELDLLWKLNPRAYAQLAPLGRTVGLPFLLLGLTLAVAAVGWFKRRVWGWWLAVVVIAVQVLGDVVNIFMGHFVEGILGAAIAGALLIYLLRTAVRTPFQSKGRES